MDTLAPSFLTCRYNNCHHTTIGSVSNLRPLEEAAEADALPPKLLETAEAVADATLLPN